MSNDLDRKLIDVLRRHLPLAAERDEFPVETDFEDLGLDSVNAIVMLLDLEETLGVVLPDSMLTESTFQNCATLQRALRSLPEIST